MCGRFALAPAELARVSGQDSCEPALRLSGQSLLRRAKSARLEWILHRRLGFHQALFDIDGPLIAVAFEIPSVDFKQAAAADKCLGQENDCRERQAVSRMW